MLINSSISYYYYTAQFLQVLSLNPRLCLCNAYCLIKVQVKKRTQESEKKQAPVIYFYYLLTHLTRVPIFLTSRNFSSVEKYILLNFLKPSQKYNACVALAVFNLGFFDEFFLPKTKNVFKILAEKCMLHLNFLSKLLINFHKSFDEIDD